MKKWIYGLLAAFALGTAVANVSDNSTRIQYTASASQTDFDYPFEITAEADIAVYVDGVLKTLTTDYTVAGEGNDNGGTITFTTGRTSGEIVTLYRDTAIARDTDFGQNAGLTSAAFNREFDKLFFITQELENKVGRALRIPQTTSIENSNIELAPTSAWASKILGFDANGQPEPTTLANLSGETFSQSLIGETFYPQTTTESSLNITPSTYIYPTEDPRRYGLAAAASAGANAIALQNAINVVANNGHGVLLVPRGNYNVNCDDLYFHYDATNNPNFPSSANRQGNINVRGEGSMDFNAFDNSIKQGTVIDCGAQTIVVGNGTSQLRNVRFEDISLVSDNSTYVLQFDLVSRGVGWNNLTLIQEGTGGGVELDNTWGAYLGYSFIYTPNVSNAGTGLYLHNSTQGAGEYFLSTVNVRAFAKNFVIGEEGTSAASMDNVQMTACQGRGGNYNLIIGNGVKSSTIDAFHNEAPATAGILLAYGASNITIKNSYNVTAGGSADYLLIGGTTGTDANDFTRNIVVTNSQFVNVTNNGIEVNTSASTRNTLINYNSFTGAVGTETAIAVENDAAHGLIIGPNFYSNVSTEISNASRVDLQIAGNTLGRHTYFAPITHAGHAETIVGVASATNIAWIDTSNFWRISGTTTINTIGTPTAGNPRIILLFTTSLTVNDASTSAGNLQLSGGANFSATANDILELVWHSNSSEWVEVSRSAN